MNEVFIAIDTSYQQGVLVVFHPEKGILFEAVANEKMSHGINLPLFLHRALEFIEQNNLSIAAIGVGLGPGSFVGIRISLSLALGFCFARNIPLMGFCSHAALNHSLPQNAPKNVVFLMKASGDLAYFSEPFKGTSIEVVRVDEIKTDCIIYTDILTVLGAYLPGPTAKGVQKAFFERIKEVGIVDESDVIKPNYVKNPSISKHSTSPFSLKVGG